MKCEELYLLTRWEIDKVIWTDGINDSRWYYIERNVPDALIKALY